MQDPAAPSEHEAEIVARIANSTMYRTLGIGSEPFAFGRRVLALMRSDQPSVDRINAVAHRLVFTEYLVEEVSRLIHGKEHASDDALSLHENIDSLEVFLLCTCIDTLAAGGRWEDYPTWLRSHMQSIGTSLSARPQATPTFDDYILATDALHSQYTSESGLTKGFADFFLGLPSSTKKFISDTMLMVRGTFWDPQFHAGMREWQSKSADDKLNRLARGYFYEVRSQYAHASQVHPVSSPSVFRRHEEAQAGAQAMIRKGWNLLLVYDDERADTVTMTLVVRSDVRESDLLRLALSTHVLNKLGLSVDDAFPNLMLSTIMARNATRGAIDEIESNKSLYRLLHRYLFPYSREDHKPSHVPILTTSATRLLISRHSDFVDLFLSDLSDYVRHVGTLNEALATLQYRDPSETPETTPIPHTIHVLDDPQVSQAYLLLDHYHENLPYNLRYHIESGQINYRYGTITDAAPAT